MLEKPINIAEFGSHEDKIVIYNTIDAYNDVIGVSVEDTRRSMRLVTSELYKYEQWLTGNHFSKIEYID
jgi:hypothetical protein